MSHRFFALIISFCNCRKDQSFRMFFFKVTLLGSCSLRVSIIIHRLLFLRKVTCRRIRFRSHITLRIQAQPNGKIEWPTLTFTQVNSRLKNLLGRKSGVEKFGGFILVAFLFSSSRNSIQERSPFEWKKW